MCRHRQFGLVVRHAAGKQTDLGSSALARLSFHKLQSMDTVSCDFALLPLPSQLEWLTIKADTIGFASKQVEASKFKLYKYVVTSVLLYLVVRH